jgi:hypothetical protein
VSSRIGLPQRLSDYLAIFASASSVSGIGWTWEFLSLLAEQGVRAWYLT